MDFGVRIVVVDRAAEGDPDAFMVGDAWVKRARKTPAGSVIRSLVEVTDAIEPVTFGGVYDTLEHSWVRPTEDPVTWYCGREQLAPILHGTGSRGPARYVCIGSAGSGKSEVGAMFAIKRTIETPGKAFGCVAPVEKRLKVCWEKMVDRLRPQWVDHDQTRKLEEIVLVNGRRFQFAAAKAYSTAFGSPLQGFTWDIGMWIDEEQDINDQSMADAAMRGRNARGKCFALSTCTLKRDPGFKERRGLYEAQLGTVVQPMTIHGSPFVSIKYLEELKSQLPADQYQMLVLAQDAPPERAIYSMFERSVHLRPWPKVGARDVTAQVTSGFDWVIGHDPGTLWDVSLGLKAFELPGVALPVWWVMWEQSTRQKLLEEHVVEVVARLRNYGGAGALVVADPYSRTTSDTRPNVESYKVWAQHGFKIRPAAYSKVNPSQPGKVPKKEGIETVRMLLRNAAGETRLYIDCDDRTRVPSARKLVAALETMEFSEAGDPETEKKDKTDMSHWPASLRYGLWPWERARLSRMKLKGSQK